MRLNWVTAPIGTVIGIHRRSTRFLIVDSVIIREYGVFSEPCGVTLRFATAQEVTREAFNREPWSYVEHLGLKRKMSPYGWVRPFGTEERK